MLHYVALNLISYTLTPFVSDQSQLEHDANF